LNQPGATNRRPDPPTGPDAPGGAQGHDADGRPTGRDAYGRPAGRYGQRSRSRRLVLVAVLVVVCAALASWLVWAALAASTPDVRATLIGFRVVDDGHVQVRFEVVADRKAAATCSVEAEDRYRETVGIATVTVPPANRAQREVETTVKTRDRAVTATVAGCRVNAHD
jgi:uncharacterized protein DUF4307